MCINGATPTDYSTYRICCFVCGLLHTSRIWRRGSRHQEDRKGGRRGVKDRESFPHLIIVLVAAGQLLGSGVNVCVCVQSKAVCLHTEHTWSKGILSLLPLTPIPLPSGKVAVCLVVTLSKFQGLCLSVK